jgi:hypothetical protein
MKPLKMINFFDSIPQINSYSHVGSSLEKLFKMSSLKYFIKTLKFKEEFHKRFLKEESVNQKEKEYDVYEMEGIKNNKRKDEQDIFSLPETNLENKPKIKNNYEINKSYFYHKKNFSTLSDSPDALKYNPNYNSISKNIPSVKIVKPLFDKTKINLRKNTLLNTQIKKEMSKKIIKDINTNKNFATINTDNNNKNNSQEGSMESNEKEKRFITEIPIKSYKNKNFFKNNSCKKYPYKLPNIINSVEIPHYMLGKTGKKRNFMNNLNSNTISFYNKNRAIDFSKMLNRPPKIFINMHSLKVPNSGYYEPRYNLIEKRQYDIHINKPIADKYKRKQILLKKIMTSYNINSKYELIDNNKLNDDALRNLNL